jgi:hypothetical protein
MRVQRRKALKQQLWLIWPDCNVYQWWNGLLFVVHSLTYSTQSLLMCTTRIRNRQFIGNESECMCLYSSEVAKQTVLRWFDSLLLQLEQQHSASEELRCCCCLINVCMKIMLLRHQSNRMNHMLLFRHCFSAHFTQCVNESEWMMVWTWVSPLFVSFHHQQRNLASLMISIFRGKISCPRVMLTCAKRE